MSEIKAIETRYKGYRFRSRLEARWAVFFDNLGIPWEYEAEGYDLGDGVRWLPDFVVGDTRTPFEVKPRGIPGDAYEKTGAFVLATGGKRAFVLSGAPWIERHDGVCDEERCQCHEIGASDPLWYDEWARTPDNPRGFFVIGSVRFSTNNSGMNSLFLTVDVDGGELYWTVHEGGDDMKSFPSPFSGALLRACQAARSARFEHGERP